MRIVDPERVFFDALPDDRFHDRYEPGRQSLGHPVVQEAVFGQVENLDQLVCGGLGFRGADDGAKTAIAVSFLKNCNRGRKAASRTGVPPGWHDSWGSMTARSPKTMLKD